MVRIPIGNEKSARIEVRSPDGTVLLSELNTMPGFTPTSVYARLMEAAGIGYPELVARLIAGLRLLASKREKNPPRKHGNLPL